jgi:lipopolysaccharide export system ATP-binding protein
MKHRLPKPKSAKAGSEDRSDLKQPELLVDGKMPPPESGTEPTRMFSPTNPISTPEKPLPPPMENAATAVTTQEALSKSIVPFSFLSGSESTPGHDSVKADRMTEISPLLLRTGNKSKGATPPPLPVRVVQKKGPPPLPARKPVPVAASADANTPVTAPVAGTERVPFLIQTRGLVKQYGGRRVVNGVDIHVRTGEVVGLLGKNGAGKTTTFYMIVGLVAPTEGHVYMSDEDVTRMPMYRRARRGIGYLPQEESIFRKLTVEENLLAILETLPMTEEERDARCDELLKDFGLEQVRENVAITLSGGEKRRVTIARALVTSPTLLLLDEPFSGVDPMAVHDIQEIILHLKQRGLGVLITDHNVRETLSVVDRAYIIDEGRVLSEGSREFLLNDPIAREIYLGHRFSM